MARKEISKEGSDVDVTLSEGESITIHICEFCNTNPCKCKFLICPFHGKVNARDEQEKNEEDLKIFRCTKPNCVITRTEKQLE